VLAHGIDPAKYRDDARRLARDRGANTFEEIWSARTAKNIIDRLEADIFPARGRKPIDKIKHRDLIAVLRKIQDRGANEIAHRQKAACSQIFSYAIQCGFSDRNLVVDMKDVLKTTRREHFAPIDTDELPALRLAVQRFTSSSMTMLT
jgi:integrase